MKNKLTDLLDRGYQAEKQLIRDLSDEERKAKGTLEKWTAKDIIAHNSHWRKHHAENLLAALAGKTPTSTDDIDHINDDIYRKYKDEPWDAIKTLAAESCKKMEKALNTLKDEDLHRENFLPWHGERPLWRFVIGNVYTHPILHLSEWHIKKGDSARAAEIYQEMTGLIADIDDSPEWQSTIRYNLACSYSLLGETEKAIASLNEALQLNPSLKEWSQEDPDFEPIREEPGYQALYE